MKNIIKDIDKDLYIDKKEALISDLEDLGLPSDLTKELEDYEGQELLDVTRTALQSLLDLTSDSSYFKDPLKLAEFFNEVEQEIYDVFTTLINDEIDVDTSNKYYDTYTFGNAGEVIVGDYDQMKKEAVEREKDLVDDIGFTSIKGWEKYVDGEEHFKQIFEEMDYSYATEIADEPSSDEDLYLNRLHEEMVERNIMKNLEDDPSITENDVLNNIQDFTQDLQSGYSSMAQRFIDEFGDKDFERVVKEKDLIDYDEIAKYIVGADGIAGALGSYDGEEYNFENLTWIIIDK